MSLAWASVLSKLVMFVEEYLLRRGYVGLEWGATIEAAHLNLQPAIASGDMRDPKLDARFDNLTIQGVRRLSGIVWHGCVGKPKKPRVADCQEGPRGKNRLFPSSTLDFGYSMYSNSIPRRSSEKILANVENIYGRKAVAVSPGARKPCLS
ncbi:hypothetical protein EI94DRAFT_1698317 [Lactarius quietus]|nr:hypothetical protein EI94DRAFT_1698317 [Lactarius quietus]